jgi:DNA-binding transcriptional MerR regulator
MRAAPLPAAAAEGGGAGVPPRNKPRKAPNAFRTISEVADELHIPQHVLRFWETKFPQVRPLKRGGGRRYYRPDDISLLRRISDLLYIEGYTIKGVQRLLREGGGRLADDIPPPPAEERAGVEPNAEAEDPQLPMPGLTAPLPMRPSGRSRAVEPRHPDPRLADENARLRRLLLEALRALEELRRLLG